MTALAENFSSKPASRTAFLNLVQRRPARSAKRSSRDHNVNVVLFTGSYEVGRRIQEISALFYDRITACEMGSKSTVIVCADASLDLAVNCALISAFKTSGQRCVSAGASLWLNRCSTVSPRSWSTAARHIRIGDPLDAANFTGPVIHQGAVEKVLGYNDLARKEGAKVLLEGGRLNGDGAATYLPSFIAWSRTDARACAKRCSVLISP